MLFEKTQEGLNKQIEELWQEMTVARCPPYSQNIAKQLFVKH